MSFFLPVVLLAGYTVSFGGPTIVRYAPELCGIAASAYLVIRIAQHGFVRIRPVYWVVMVLIALHLLFGIIANQVQVGTVIIGGRLYLRTIPFFLLALTLVPTEAALKRQFLLILGVALLQLPVAVYQRLSNIARKAAEGVVSTTGDYTMGTLGNSGYLSIFLICFAAVLVALYARKQLPFRLAAPILLLVLIPTTINETKATLFLVPLAIAIPFVAAARTNRLLNAAKAVLIFAGFLAIFIPVYDHFMMPRYGYSIVDFFQMEGRVEGYLAKGAEVGTTEQIGRLDGVAVAYDVLMQDPSTAMLGLGMGNVTESAFGPQYQGEYFYLYGGFGNTTYSQLFWEIGFVGTGLVLFLITLIALDAKRLHQQNNAYGILALAYLAILPIMAASMFYKNLLTAPGIGVCFWYYCGVIAAAAGRTSEAVKSAGVVPVRRHSANAGAIRSHVSRG